MTTAEALRLDKGDYHELTPREQKFLRRFVAELAGRHPRLPDGFPVGLGKPIADAPGNKLTREQLEAVVLYQQANPGVPYERARAVILAGDQAGPGAAERIQAQSQAMAGYSHPGPQVPEGDGREMSRAQMEAAIQYQQSHGVPYEAAREWALRCVAPGE